MDHVITWGQNEYLHMIGDPWLPISRIWNFVSIFNRSRVIQRFLLRKIGHETKNWVTWRCGGQNEHFRLIGDPWLPITHIWNFVSICSRSLDIRRFLLVKIGHVTENWVTWSPGIKMKISIWSAIVDFLLTVFGTLCLSSTVLEIYADFSSWKYVTWPKTGSRDHVGSKWTFTFDWRPLTTSFLKFCSYP